VNFKCRVFGGKTGPCPMVWVFGVVRPVATVRFRVERYSEPTREFRPIANTTCGKAERRNYLALFIVTGLKMMYHAKRFITPAIHLSMK
jgi:hypothetical protein